MFDPAKDRLVLVTGDADGADLRDTAGRALGATSVSEWLEAMNTEQRAAIAAIENDIRATTDDLYAVFSVLTVDVRTLESLEADRVPLDIPQSTKTPQELCRLLRDRVGGHARFKVTFNRASLLASLKKEDPAFAVAPGQDERAIRDAARSAGDILRGQKATFGKTAAHVSRAAVDEIVRWANSPESGQTVAMILGDAGRGKTVVVRDVLAALDAAGVATVAVKADIQLSGVKKPSDLQERLGLPEPLARVLTVLGRDGEPVVLLVDQVDALSHNLAQDGTTLDVLLVAVLGATRIRNVRIVLSCRTFDAASDPRLRRLELKKEFRVGDLSAEEVKNVLAAANVDFDTLSSATRDLLRTPLHLDLFLWLKDRGLVPGAPAALQDLYAAILRDIALVHDPAAPSIADRERTIERVADAMAQEQRTTVLLTTVRADAAMESSLQCLGSHGILTIENDRVTLLHQTFFDFLYARRFVNAGTSLVEYLLRSPQALRERTELVQILTYARGTIPATYLAWLDALYNAPPLRSHLHRLLVRWFGQLPNPTADEMAWLTTRLNNSSERSEFFDGMRGNAAWIPGLFRALGDLLTSSDERTIDDVVTFFGSIANAAQSYLVPYLRSYVEKGEAWGRRIFWILSWIRTWRDPAAVELFEEIAARQDLPLGHFFEFKDMAALHPASLARIARALLARVADRAYADGVQSGSATGAFDALAQTDLADALDTLARNHATIYLDTLLPWFLDVLGRTSSGGGTDRYRHDLFGFAWRLGFDRTPASVSHGIVGALKAEATVNGERFRAHLAALQAADIETAQVIVASVYAACPDRADDAIAFLLADPRRLRLGDFLGRTRALIAAAVPHARNDAVAALEADILTLRDPYPPRDLDDLKRSGLYQYYLLAAFPPEHLSTAGKRRLGELARKFPMVDTATLEPRPIVRSRFERSPISADRAMRMSDKNWRRAIAKYSRTTDPFAASSRQLAESLKTAAKADPSRFAAFFDTLPSGTGDDYIVALIQTLGDAFPVLPPGIIGTITRFAETASSDVRRQIAWTMRKHPESCDEPLLKILECWVRDPALDTIQWSASLDYLNPDRGSAFLAVMFALRVRGTHEAHARRWTLFDYVTREGPPYLRAAAIEELRYELFLDDAPTSGRGLPARLRLRSRRRQNAECALRTFEELIASDTDMLSANYADDFIRLALSVDASRMLTVIRRMLHAEDAALQERGASLAAIGAVARRALSHLDLWRARRLVRQALRSPEPKTRAEVAKILAYNMHGPSAAYCVRKLKPLLYDRDRDVRAAIGVVFHHVPEATVRQRAFLRAYAGSPAIPEADYFFGEFLLEQIPDDPSFGLDLASAAVPHIAKADYPHGDDLLRYILRVASSAAVGPALLTRAMDVFDVADAGLGRFASNLLSEWDRP
jgi:hypothetical protein